MPTPTPPTTPAPLVSICCAACNHAPYIAQALDSFLAQTPDLPIEVLVHDDASTDATPDILRDYARRYPDVVKPLYERENQYSRGVAIDPTFNYPRARGRYIALCEGDDYWTDPHKLRRQVDYMQAHPECTFLFTNARVLDAQNPSAPMRPFLPFTERDAPACPDRDRAYTLGDLCALNFLPTATFLFPRAALEALPPDFWRKPCPHGDLKLRMYLAAAGQAAYLHADTAVYRENVASGAMSRWSRESGARAAGRARSVADMLSDVDAFSRGQFSDPLRRMRDWYLYVELMNAPDAAPLRDPDVRRVYRALPLRRRLRYRLKRLIAPLRG